MGWDGDGRQRIMTWPGAKMDDDLDWAPPQTIKEIYDKASSMGGMNRPTTGKRSEEELEVGNAPFQFYSLATPNGQKPAIRKTIQRSFLLFSQH